ncbi:MAG: hypothetical protein RLZZ524_3142 [Pseudomonadota bacterium]|jgi:hypothetical protein
MIQVRFRLAALSTVLLTALWFGLVCDMAGPRGLGLFMCWYCVIVSLVVLTPSALQVLAKTKTFPSVPNWLDSSVDIAVLVLLAWHARYITAGAWLLHALLKSTAKDKVRKMREDAGRGTR